MSSPASRRLPKPGPWMDRLKRFLAIPMWLSAAAAMWLLYRQTGHRGLIIAVAITIGLLFALSEFVVAWGIAYYYARRANSEFDPMAAAIVRDAEQKLGGRK